MSDLLSQAAARFPDEVFIEDAGQSFTFSQTEERVAQRAGELGPRTSDQLVVRPGIDAGSVIELLAVLRSGATAVVISRQLAEERVRLLTGLAAADQRPCHSIIFTSGSSGATKGVRFSAENWQAAATASVAAFGHSQGERWLCPLPLHHVGGIAIIFRSLAVGGRVVLAGDLSQTVRWLDRVQYASLVPTQLYRILQRRTDRFTGSPCVLIGGSAADRGLLDKAAASGLIVLPTYGMTETTSQVATARRNDPARRLYPLPGIEIRICGNREQIIEVLGPTVALGYLGEPEHKPDQWFATSDRGQLEPDGSLVVLGRIDRVIITGGENVDPAEIEAMLTSYPGVKEVAVLGLPDNEWGQVVAAAYVGGVEAAELSTHVRKRLAPEATPKRWLRLEELPRNELGKIDVPALGALFDA